MKKDEGELLKKASSLREEYAKAHPCLLGYFQHIPSLRLPSLRSFSFQKDLAFFRECSHILSIIETIAHHPRIVSKNQDEILRADQASNVTPSSFLLTMEDPSLWKRKSSSLSPEYVHVEESEDDIFIYENLFVAMALRRIEREVSHYRDFYSSLILTTSSSRLTEDGDHVLEGFEAIKPCFNKIERIKKSDFYKRVGKQGDLQALVATNILKSDPLYGRVYRFYSRLSTPTSLSEERRELLHYVLVFVLDCLNRSHFELLKGYRQKRNLLRKEGASFAFQNSFFLLKIGNVGDEALRFDLSSLSSPDKKASHLLFIHPGYGFSEFLGRQKLYPGYSSYSALSIWNLASLGQKATLLGQGSKDVGELVRIYLDSLLSSPKASEEVYSLYCPHCKKKGVLKKGEGYFCPHCHSSYYLDQGRLWFAFEAKEER